MRIRTSGDLTQVNDRVASLEGVGGSATAGRRGSGLHNCIKTFSQSIFSRGGLRETSLDALCSLTSLPQHRDASVLQAIYDKSNIASCFFCWFAINQELRGPVNTFYRAGLGFLLVVLTSCATRPLSEQLLGRPIPPATSLEDANGVEIAFSADKKYETSDGVPLRGDPLLCSQGKIFRVNGTNENINKITMKLDEKVVVASVISWQSGGFRKVCGPFVMFTPEPGAKYVVVNERIGGKGWSIMWTGIAFQTCRVSVYRETPSGFTSVGTRPARSSECTEAKL